MKSNIKKIIKEMIPIIAGILIAMFINNWNEDRKDAKYINKILSSINKELRESNEEITEMLIKQKSFIDTVEIYQKDEVVSIYEITNKIGIGIPSIKTNAWVALSNSRIELIDYDKLSSLANIEEGKEILKLKVDKLINFIYPRKKLRVF